MTDIRPVDLPEVRADIIDWLDGPVAAELWRKSAMAGHYDWDPTNPTRDPETGHLLLRTEIIRLRQASLFYVAADMVALARVAARSIPDFQLAPEDPPTESGLIAFEQHAASITINDEHLGITAVCWGPHPIRSDVVMGTIYLDRTDGITFFDRHTRNRRVADEPRLIHVHGGEFFWPFGTNEGDSPSGLIAELGPVLRATWLLMQQPLTIRSDTALPRAARRRLQRAGHEPSAVRLIELRRPRGDTAPAASASAREYQHQWIVRGHWRQQWYPARQVHRPVWIVPHVKGPEGAPLIGGEKVNVWKR